MAVRRSLVSVGVALVVSVSVSAFAQPAAGGVSVERGGDRRGRRG